jgi:thymidylate synthase (FAD)
MTTTEKTIDPGDLFHQLGGNYCGPEGNPVFHTEPRATSAGTSYLRDPGVALYVRPRYCQDALRGFLQGFAPELEFMQYLDDEPLGGADEEGVQFEPGGNIAKTAGQLCYLSFGPGRTKNADGSKYHGNIKTSRHGSVLEHPTYSFLVYGIDRSFTHELVRHRVGVAYSQVSQRYVDGKTLRFVERPEYQRDAELHARFESWIDRCTVEYDEVAKHLARLQAQGDATLSGEKRTELRKKVNQCARSRLPNETEAPIMFSGNVRAIRHVIEMRADGPADLPIRAVGVRLLLIMKQIEPTLFDDYSIVKLSDGTFGMQTEHRKV